MGSLRLIAFLIFVNVISPAFIVYGQEKVGHLDYNPYQFGNAQLIQNKSTERTTLASKLLPFFEDFTGYRVFPDPTKWLDFQVYINNTMGVSPIERGVATFDGLNELGRPYDSFNNANFRYADSLTSWPINLGLNNVVPGDSVYFSFFYQPQGNGYFPQTGDSLMLFFKDKYGEYVKVWAIPGKGAGTVMPFQQVMIPIFDTIYFDSAFQFRFVNIAAMFWADADWNLDYIRLNSHRSMTDTAVNDLGFSSNPSNLLNDYTSMPYRQFYADPAGETATRFYDSVHDNDASGWNDNYAYNAVCLNNGAVLASGTGIASFSGSSISGFSVPTYTTVVTPPGPDTKVVFENTFYIGSVSSSDPTANDTIVKDQVFDNYLAYDDGTAEKSYYLNLFPPDEGEVGIEYHLNQPDTMRGMAIYFGRQIPYASYKDFSIAVWSSLAGVNGAVADNLIYQQDLYTPGYADTINHFWYYVFDNPVPLPAGVFYAGTIQPAEGSSDSLYFGLDVNRRGYNHVFYNVVGTWVPSSISGAVMMRPLLGQSVQPTAVKDVQNDAGKWSLLPNPARDKFHIQFPGDAQASYQVKDVQGRTILSGATSSDASIDISGLTPGIYFVRLDCNGVSGRPQKLIKL